MPVTAASIQPRIRIHVSTANRGTGQAVVDFLGKSNLGRLELKTVRPAPKSDELYYKEGRDELATRIASLLGLRSALSKDLSKTDVAIYLSDSYRMPGASGSGGSAPPSPTGRDPGSGVGRPFTEVLRASDYRAEAFGLVQAFTSYSLKKRDADASTSLRTGELGGGMSLSLANPHYEVGLQMEYARVSFPGMGHDARLDVASLARLTLPAAGFDFLGQLRLGVSALGPFGGDNEYGPVGAIGLGGLAPVPRVEKAHMVALAEYHIATYPKPGFDWFFAHGLSVKVGAGMRF